MKQYPEILALEKFIENHHVLISVLESTNAHHLFIPIQLSINNQILIVNIEDEYDDLELNNPIMNTLLTLKALSIIDDSDDFLHWLKLNQIKTYDNHLLDYYKDIVSKLNMIKSCFSDNDIDYFISDLDFELNSGAAQYLRQNSKI